MPNYIFKGFIFAILAFAVGGCTTTKTTKPENAGHVSARGYIMDKERLDQDMEGNYGYIYGTPKPPDRSDFKKTRKIYVLEVTKEAGKVQNLETTTAQTTPPASVDTSIPADLLRSNPPATRKTVPAVHQPLVIPPIDEGREEEPRSVERQKNVPAHAPSAATGSTEYTVEKGDTLQKISKKFYNTYSKWQRILDANKDVMSNPNSIKPGMVLKIPTEQSNAPNLK